MLPRPHRSGALHEAQEWLTRAERDLQAARNELNARPPLPEMTAFHVQQAAEKVLKAFLTARSIPFRYTHDLVVLQAQCEAASRDLIGSWPPRRRSIRMRRSSVILEAH